MPQPLNGNSEAEAGPDDEMTVGEIAAQAEDASEEPQIASTNPEDIEARQNEGRRARARREHAENKKRLEDIEAGLSRHKEETASALSMRDQEIMRLREENARLLGRTDAANGQQQERDPQELRKLAREALKAEKLDEYEQLRDEAVRIETRRETRMMLGEVVQQIPRPQHPDAEAARRHIEALTLSHRAVRAKGREGQALVSAKYTELGVIEGLPDGPERMERAYALAEAQLGRKNGKPSYDQENRTALTGGGSRSESNGQDDRPQMDSLAKKMARLAKISDDQYIANMDK